MYHSLIKIALVAFSLLFYAGCRQQSEQPVPEDFGYLALSIKLEIEESTANGRLETVDISTFKVTIFTEDGTEYQSFEPFSSAPPEVQLPTGYYYVEAHSNNEAEAAFENPYYYGISDVFGIDKEETTEIDVDVELANMKVAINYSTNVTSTFVRYSGAVTVNSTGTILPYVQGETREGYFAIAPVSVTVDLSYDMLDGSTIDRTYTANIDDPQPKTLYTINVDASLEDGVISFNINVDESFEEEIILIGESNLEPALDIISNYGGSYLEWLRTTTQLSDGSIVLAGATISTDGDITRSVSTSQYIPDAWAIRVNNQGNLIWQTLIGGTRDEYFNQVVATIDGGVAMIGTTWSSDVDLQGVMEATDNGNFWLVKMNIEGQVEWQKSYGGRNGDQGWGLDQTSDGGYIAVGRTASLDKDVTGNYGSDDIWVMKTDVVGNLEWQKNIGGSDFDRARKVKEISNGTYVLLAETDSDDIDITTGNNGGTDVFVVNFDQDNIYWTKTIGGSANDYVQFLEIDPDGSILIGSLILSPELGIEGPSDVQILRVDDSGNELATYWIRGPGRDNVSSLLPADNGYFLAGSKSASQYNSNIWFARVDQDFSVIYENEFGGSKHEAAFGIYSDGTDLLLPGSSESTDGDITFPKGATDFILTKLKY